MTTVVGNGVPNVNKITAVQKYVVVAMFIQPMGGYRDNRSYDFICNIPVQDEDIVVVDTASGLQLAKVVGIKKSSNQATKWVVQKVDLNEHHERIRVEMQRQQLEKEMERRAKEINKIEQYRSLAEKDPAMATMLREYESLGAQALVWEQGPPMLAEVSSSEVTQVKE